VNGEVKFEMICGLSTFSNQAVVSIRPPKFDSADAIAPEHAQVFCWPGISETQWETLGPICHVVLGSYLVDIDGFLISAMLGGATPRRHGFVTRSASCRSVYPSTRMLRRKVCRRHLSHIGICPSLRCVHALCNRCDTQADAVILAVDQTVAPSAPPPTPAAADCPPATDERASAAATLRMLSTSGAQTSCTAVTCRPAVAAAKNLEEPASEAAIAGAVAAEKPEQLLTKNNAATAAGKLQSANIAAPRHPAADALSGTGDSNGGAAEAADAEPCNGAGANAKPAGSPTAGAGLPPVPAPGPPKPPRPPRTATEFEKSAHSVATDAAAAAAYLGRIDPTTLPSIFKDTLSKESMSFVAFALEVRFLTVAVK
jgi:Potential Monad-binding region of RPAP3